MKPVYSIQLMPNSSFEIYNQKPDGQLSQVKQVHGPVILDYQKGFSNPMQEADGIVLFKDQMTPGTSYQLAIKTADCLPIALVGKNGFCHLHAGWRGLAQNILAQSQVKEIEPTLAIIGPSIRVQNYEVGEAFYSNFSSKRAFEKIDEKVHFNLQKEAIEQIKDLFSKIEIIDSGICTFSDHTFHSFRREKGELRNWNILNVSI